MLEVGALWIKNILGPGTDGRTEGGKGTISKCLNTTILWAVEPLNATTGLNSLPAHWGSGGTGK